MPGDSRLTARVAFVWEQFGPYHMDRCEAAAAAFGEDAILGIEIAAQSRTYAWVPAGLSSRFIKHTLFPGETVEEVSHARRLWRLLRKLWRSDARHVFLCNPDRPSIFLAAMLLRLAGRRVYVMTESKFDDRPRQAWRECLKRIFYLPYRGALVGGARSADYMHYLGFARDRIATGYDSVSLARVRSMAGAPPAPDGTPFAERRFTVIARLVEKKNLAMLIDAYRIYCASEDVPRDLAIYGSGPLEAALHERAAGLSGVCFEGFVQERDVAQGLARALALILPSTEEQWGLVVNEALAMGVPPLVTEQVGARDSLVRAGVDGFIIEPDDPEGLARLMGRVAGDEVLWRRLAEGTRQFAPAADAPRFAEGVAKLMGIAIA